MAAIKQGYYHQEGLDVSLEKWHPKLNIVEEVASDRVQFGVAYGMAITDYIKGAPIKLVMSSFQFSPMVLLTHQPIKKWSDLDGKVLSNFENLYIRTLMARMSGESSAKVTLTSASGNLQDFIDGKVDIYGAYQTNEPYRLQKLGVPFHILDPKSYGIQGYGDLVITSETFSRLHPDIVKKFKLASIKGWEYALSHQAEIVDYMVAHYPVIKSRDALLDEAQKTAHFVKPGDVPIGSVDPAKLLVSASEAKDIGLISQQQLEQFDPAKFIFDCNNPAFTPEERAYLAKHPVVKLANDIDWEPFEFIDDQGRYKGIAADYFKLLGDKLGIVFQPVKRKNWAEVVELTKSGQLDVYSCAVASPERKEYMRFTKPYLSFPMVLVSKSDMSFVQQYDQLNGKTVAVVKDYWSDEYLKQNYPRVNRLLVENVKQGLEAVIDGRADAYSGNLGVVNFTVKRYGLTGLNIVGQSKERFELAVGVQKDDPILFNILQKGLASITEPERQAIYNKWIQLEMVNQLDRRQLIEIAVLTSSVVLVMLLILLIYRYQKKKQQAYINQIHELTYATLIEIPSFKIVRASDSFTRLSGYSKEELQNMSYYDMAPNEMTQKEKDDIAAWVLAGNTWKGEITGKTKAGEHYYVELTLTPVKDFWGKVTQVWARRFDITDKKRIEKLSIVDELTGLYNRRHFNEVIEREINRAKRQHTSLSVAMLDIDYFKSINDTYGHQHGDQVLKDVAGIFRSYFHRANDFVFRMGGEEFLILSAFDSQEEFERYLEKLCRHVEGLKIENRQSPYKVLTVSIGAIFCQAGNIASANQIYHLSDEMLYQAKQRERNCVMMYHPESIKQDALALDLDEKESPSSDSSQ